MSKTFVDIVFDGPPEARGGRFVEVENENRASISFGSWVQRDDGYWVLRIPQWCPIESLPETDEMIIAKTADGRRMIYRVNILRNALKPNTPAHLRFPAIAWMPVPE